MKGRAAFLIHLNGGVRVDVGEGDRPATSIASDINNPAARVTESNRLDLLSAPQNQRKLADVG